MGTLVPVPFLVVVLPLLPPFVVPVPSPWLVAVCVCDVQVLLWLRGFG